LTKKRQEIEKELESYIEDVIIDYDIEKRYLKLKLNPEGKDLFDEFLELVKIKEMERKYV